MIDIDLVLVLFGSMFVLSVIFGLWVSTLPGPGFPQHTALGLKDWFKTGKE